MGNVIDLEKIRAEQLAKEGEQQDITENSISDVWREFSALHKETIKGVWLPFLMLSFVISVLLLILKLLLHF